MATLTYRHFGNPGRSHHRARYAIVHKKAFDESFPSFYSAYPLVMRASANRAAAARGGWRPHTSRGGFFDLIYVIIDAIGTCMQNFIEIDRQKNQAFFI